MTRDTDAALKQIAQTLSSGQKILFVLGAGASVAAQVPLMITVYKSLSDHLARLEPERTPPVENDNLLPLMNMTRKTEDNDATNVASRIRILKQELSTLAGGDGSQSMAARVLGTFQRSRTKTSADQLDDLCAEVWAAFSEDFVKGNLNAEPSTSADYSGQCPRGRFAVVSHDRGLTSLIAETQWRQKYSEAEQSDQLTKEGPYPTRTPTILHHLVGSFAALGYAHVISLNFDGLTRQGIANAGSHIYPDAPCRAIVISDKDGVRNFWLGESSHSQRLVPVYKIWGDVFHTVCTNPRCPEFGSRTPIFSLSDTSQELKCQVCALDRQLEIYFAGYEEKEIQSESMLRTLLNFLAPQIGCVITVGVSGTWDRALGEFLYEMCSIVENYGIFAHGRHGRESYCHTSCICVDPKDSHLIDKLQQQGLRTLHLKCEADTFADLFDVCIETGTVTSHKPTANPSSDAVRGIGPDHLLEDRFWKPRIAEGDQLLNLMGIARETYTFLYTRDVEQYLHQFKNLQQLGIKTLLCKTTRDGDKDNHNRHYHSLGATSLAALWLDSIHDKVHATRTRYDQPSLDLVYALTLLAVRHHDVGHLPFTHLMEEIFDEVHWVTRIDGKRFKHDEPVLFELGMPGGIPASDLSGAIDRFFSEYVRTMKRSGADTNSLAALGNEASVVKHVVELFCQGHSGIPWVDAIINSPLDVDKMDYVFRDCHYLDQGLHIKADMDLSWLTSFFSECRILPSGLIALSGDAGEKARDFIEERVWLYQHGYFKPAFRAVERVVRHAVMQWLLRKVTHSLHSSTLRAKYPSSIIRDTRSLKGKMGRHVLWEMVNSQGDNEGELLGRMIDEVREGAWGIPLAPGMLEWLGEAGRIFKGIFSAEGNRSQEDLLGLIKSYGVTMSDRIYVRVDSLTDVREFIRKLEHENPCGALFDVAELPRALSYPSSRRFRYGHIRSVGECFAVPDSDPGKWHRATNHWIPLSESAYASFDDERWATIMAVAIGGRSDLVQQSMDRLRLTLRTKGKDYSETAPTLGMLGGSQR